MTLILLSIITMLKNKMDDRITTLVLIAHLVQNEFNLVMKPYGIS